MKPSLLIALLLASPLSYAWDGTTNDGDEISVETYDHQGQGEGPVEYYDYGSGEYKSCAGMCSADRAEGVHQLVRGRAHVCSLFKPPPRSLASAYCQAERTFQFHAIGGTFKIFSQTSRRAVSR